MDNPPLISVIIAVHNSKQTLRACLESYVAQTYPRKELIVIDGGSTDGSPDLIREYAHAISYWQSEADRGIYDAWNKGISYAKGDWVTFIGADDAFSDPEALEALASAATADTDLVYARAAVIDGAGRRRCERGEAWDYERMKRDVIISHPGSLHRRPLFEQHGVFDDSFRIAADYEFLLRVGARARARFVDRVVVDVGDAGVSNKQRVRLLRERFAVHAAHAEIGPVRATWHLCRGIAAYGRAFIRKIFA